MVKNKKSDESLEKPFTQEAHEFLKILGRWVYLRQTNPSLYDDYHEATRKFLETFKTGK